MADITYIRLAQEFVYLAVVVDGFSRRAVGWALDRSLQTRLTVAALEWPLPNAGPRPAWCITPIAAFSMPLRRVRRLLAQHGMTASMSRPANPYDNAQCESFIKTLKQEEISANAYAELEDLRGHLREFIEDYYNVCGSIRPRLPLTGRI